MMEVSAAKQSNGSLSQDSQIELVRCEGDVDDETFHIRALFDGKAQVKNGSQDVEVNITECTVSSNHGLVQAECQDTTEISSSFDNSVSGTQNVSTFSDIEVESPFCGGNSLASVFQGHNGASLMRKKKLTDHWRRFIWPIMWRCKWIELQIKEFQSQALKYNKELAEYDQRKQFEFEKLTLQGIDAKSRPFSCGIQRNQIMKRKKRKRVEETTDLASYMSQHNLFYYDCKRSAADCAFMENDCGITDNMVVSGNDVFDYNDGWPSLEFRGGDNSLEQMLSKIEVVQSQVDHLKSRIDKVVTENPGKFCLINGMSLLVPCDTLTNCDQHAATPSENGDGRPSGYVNISSLHISECNMGDLFMPESTVSGHEEVICLPDRIGSAGQPKIRGSCENYKEVLLKQDPGSEEDLQNFERLISRLTENPEVSTRKLNGSSPVTVPEADLSTETTMPHDQPTSSKSNVFNNRRKQGTRKSRTAKWSRRSSGVEDKSYVCWK